MIPHDAEHPPQPGPATNRLDSARHARQAHAMKRNGDVIYLTRKQVDEFHEQKHRDRVALTRRVERGEITAAEANREASIFKPEIFDPAKAITVNLAAEVANLIKLKPRKHGRSTPKTVRA